MMKNLSTQREHLALLLSIVVMTLLGLNFVAHHIISQPFELRFLVSGSLLAIVTLYLRYLPPVVNHLYKALYRVAAVMTFWSFGFFLFPIPGLSLYLISFPAFYFLYRIEVKKTVQDEDLIACGLLLALGTLIYFQQHHFNMLLFDQKEFDWADCFRNAPLLMLIGVGAMRLHKHTEWHGVCLLGTILLLAGTVLTGSVFMKISPYSEVLCAVFVTHLFMLFMLEKNPILGYFKSFCGLADEEFQRYSAMVWILSLLLMHACVIYLLLLPGGNVAVVPLSLAALFLSLYRYRKLTLSLLLTECIMLFLIAGLILFPHIHTLWQIPSAVVLLSCVFLRRKKEWAHLVPNLTILLLIALYYIQFSGNIVLDYMGLLLALLPLLCWMMIPSRPLPITRKHHWMTWPFLSAVVILFTCQGHNSQLITVWALVIIVPPAILYVILNSRFSESLMVKHELRFLSTWRASGKTALFYLTIVSVLVSAAGFAANYQWFVESWTPIIQTGIVFLTGIFIYLYMAAFIKKTSYVMLAEFLIWATIGLVRWKFDTLGKLNFGSPADGYFLIAAGVIAAGIREVIRKKVPEFTSYFQKTTLFYGIAGWLYLQALQFIHTGETVSFSHHGELASILMAMLSFRLSKTIKRSNLIYSFVFANAAILLFFFKKDYSNLLFYVLPAAGSALVLVQLFKESLTQLQIKNIRLTISLIICGTSGFYNIVDFNESIWFPVIATLVASGGVLLGISLRIRIYLYMGMVFFLVNSAGVVGHIIVNQPPENMLVFIAMLFLLGGIPLIAVFVTLQIKRQQILGRYRKLMDEIGTWE